MHKSCISYWYPKIKGVVPVPVTEIYNEESVKDGMYFCDWLKETCNMLGFPVLLRTGNFIGEIGWENTCFIKSPERVIPNMLNLVSLSRHYNLDLPISVWAVSQYIPSTVFFIADRYGNMPVIKKVKGYIKSGVVLEGLSFTDREFLAQGISKKDKSFDLVYSTMCELDVTEKVNIQYMLFKIASIFTDGQWEIEFFKSDKGKWFLYNMIKYQETMHNAPEILAHTDQAVK